MVQGIDRRTGKAAWRWQTSATPRAGFHAIPRLFVEQEHVIVFAGGVLPNKSAWQTRLEYAGSVSCLDYRTGRLRWEQPVDLGLQGQRCNVTLLIDSGQVVVGFATHVLAFALENGAPQWRHDIREATNATSAVALALPGLAVQADGRD